MASRPSIFDSIRVKPSKDKAAKQGEQLCEWAGCDKKGEHRAPKGRDREGEFFWFCAEHVRQYNKNYNYFSGMDDESIATYQKASSTGHRPTWEMGVNSWGQKQREEPVRRKAPNGPWDRKIRDPHGMYSARAAGRLNGEQDRKGRKVKRLEKQHLDRLGLNESATGPEIKSKYKQLVKIHHPDANGGDRSSEDRLREIIQAYNFLKSAGFTD